MKPKLILHPGFPKCATSTIQLLFVKQNHAVAKALDLSFIGADFKPNNGFPSVSKLMYDYNACLADIEGNDYPSGSYFMSNEALKMHPQFISALKERFDITRTVCTVRFPITQSISHFRYSGWLTGTFADFVKPKKNYSIYSIATKYSLKNLGSLAESTCFVPVEGAKELRFEERFCQTAFGQVPAILNQKPFKKLPRVNAAPSLAFAEALARAVKKRGIKILGPDKQRIVFAAKSHELPEELHNLGKPQIALLNRRRVIDCMNEYQAFLIEHGSDRRVATDARANAAKAYAKLCEQLEPTSAQYRALDEEAQRLLDSVL